MLQHKLPASRKQGTSQRGDGKKTGHNIKRGVVAASRKNTGHNIKRGDGAT